MPDAFEEPDYMSTALWTPKKPLVIIPERLLDEAAPVYGSNRVGEHDNDLTAHHSGSPLGERIVITGRVTDSIGKPVRNTLIEIWQANSAGKYVHEADQYPSPKDPNFTGAGRTVTDDEGRYTFTSIMPGAYPWWTDPRSWRARHIHFSLTGRGITDRLITQMYFPGDPLLALDPVYLAVRDEKARDLNISSLDWERTVPEKAIAYRYDIVLGGANPTPLDED
ncbi:MAG TPA: protocatechuate 3,4-dioxygenase subunit beta [Baekduia sp.]|uniref:protocatechuate 3,4-dioxygenase subunit beta n=1 Tax=Baekduia sp. TaxID=2600305 RepID=UPI002D7839E1|nr:protocatechuate 3,4-dioxygenase subunit beta [Baekduia sp.]HET6508999.1 protocatechuate 3,4-dioxygenase subunit beta [Baekduia sp.]